MEINKSDKFCSKCGKTLLAEQVGAETLVKYSMYGGFSYKPYNAFDSKTGERNLAIRFFCPDTHWWNSHTDYSTMAEPKE